MLYERQHRTEDPRPEDCRSPYQRDRSRLIHSAAFRRLQGKTQIMGPGEGDFHRTRLTHSIECAQIGGSILQILERQVSDGHPLAEWMPERDLIEAACFAHDLGHPPFGHGGEKALNTCMSEHGGFEGNGQTLRILTKLEKYKSQNWGIDPTRRMVLAVLKYPVPRSKLMQFNPSSEPIKSYYDEEIPVVRWATSDFSEPDKVLFEHINGGKPVHCTFDCSIMNLSDDIAYGLHDLEDIIGRGLVSEDEILYGLQNALSKGIEHAAFRRAFPRTEELTHSLLSDSYSRKQALGELVNGFISRAEVHEAAEFEHPLLRYRVALPAPFNLVLKGLKDLTKELVIKRAPVAQLEHRGKLIVGKLFAEFIKSPETLIPREAWLTLATDGSTERRVCDYIAGMTDSYAERIYGRLFIPGKGSSADEL